MRVRIGFLVLTTAVVVPAILLADGPGIRRQAALASVAAAFLVLLVRGAGVPASHVAIAMVIATGLEVSGSLLWGLYTYRNAAIPLYVPFGHGVFYTLAVAASRDPGLIRRSRALVRGVLAAGTVYAFASLLLARDQSGAIMWVLALLLMRVTPSPLMLAACCVATVSLEWVGTAIGNWIWAPVVPGLGLSSANPPCGVAVCYVLLDLLTVAACRTRLGRTTPAEAGVGAPASLAAAGLVP